MKFSHKQVNLQLRLLVLFTFLLALASAGPIRNNRVTHAETPPPDEVVGPSQIPGPEVPLPTGEGSARNFRPPVPEQIESRQIQHSPHASDSYVVWVEESEAVNPSDNVEGILDDSADIIGKDLRTNSSIVVSNSPGRQDNPAISGSVVVWQQRGARCSDCNRDIIAKDLATGTTYNVATGPNDQRYPAIADRIVVWLEDVKDVTYLTFRKLDTLDDPTTLSTQIAKFPWEAHTTVLAPVISSEYIAWAQIGPGDETTQLHGVAIEVYNRSTGVISTVAKYVQSEWRQPEYALDGHDLLWDEDDLHLLDLNTNESFIFPTGGDPVSPSISGDTILWSMNSGITSFCLDVYGIQLSDPSHAAKPLVTGEGCTTGALAVGDTLIWANRSGPEDGLVTTTSLSDAFRTSDARQAEIDAQVPQERIDNNWPPTAQGPSGPPPEMTPTALPEAPQWTNYRSKGIHTSNGIAWLQPDGQACTSTGACPGVDAMGATQPTTFFGSYVILTSDLDYYTTYRNGVNIRPNSSWGPQVKHAARYLVNTLNKRVLIRYFESNLDPGAVDSGGEWSPARYASDIVLTQAWRSWIKNLEVHNEPNNNREWKTTCSGCHWTGGYRNYSWTDYYDRQFFEAVRDFYQDMYWNLNYYRTNYNYCHNVDPIRCNILANMKLWSPPLAAIEKNMNGTTQSPYSVLQSMIDMYNHFGYNLYPSPKRHTTTVIPGLLINYTWSFFTSSMQARLEAANNTMPSLIPEFGWDPGDLYNCPDPNLPGPNGSHYHYNQSSTWLATNTINSQCNTADHLDHILDQDVPNYINTGRTGQRHNVENIHPFHIRGGGNGSENDGLDALGNMRRWLFWYATSSPNP